jgi:hypothetical protein
MRCSQGGYGKFTKRVIRWHSSSSDLALRYLIQNLDADVSPYGRLLHNKDLVVPKSGFPEFVQIRWGYGRFRYIHSGTECCKQGNTLFSCGVSSKFTIDFFNDLTPIGQRCTRCIQELL